MVDPAQPVLIELEPEAHSVVIAWQDGHHSTFSWDRLRATCPCVECRGGHEAMSQPVDPDLMTIPLREPAIVEKLSQVGNYALGIRWQDGHDTGIYPWEMLRDLCPCEQCRPS